MSAKEEFLVGQKRQVLNVVALIEELLARESLSQIDVIALGTLLQNAYTGIESILRCLLLMKGSKIEKTEGWHQELLQQSAREGFVSDAEFQALRELLKFRHLHMHGYAHTLEEARTRKLAAPVPKLVREYFDAHRKYFDGK